MQEYCPPGVQVALPQVLDPNDPSEVLRWARPWAKVCEPVEPLHRFVIGTYQIAQYYEWMATDKRGCSKLGLFEALAACTIHSLAAASLAGVEIESYFFDGFTELPHAFWDPDLVLNCITRLIQQYHYMTPFAGPTRQKRVNKKRIGTYTTHLVEHLVGVISPAALRPKAIELAWQVLHDVEWRK